MIVYAIAKYLVYSLWCYVGLRMLAGQMTPLRPALALVQSVGCSAWCSAF